jgi:hypothetical protein
VLPLMQAVRQGHYLAQGQLGSLHPIRSLAVGERHQSPTETEGNSGRPFQPRWRPGQRRYNPWPHMKLFSPAQL